MKIVEMNKVNGKIWEKAINSYEVVTVTTNNNTITADLFTRCKKVSTAIRRFFKTLEGCYAFNEYKKRIEESVKQKVFEEDAINEEGFAFSISGGSTYYYISVTIPSEEEEPEPEPETLDKNKKQILKQWKALAESNLNSKELNEQAKEFYNLFKSVLVENKTQLNGNEYRNIISSLRAYGDTKPAKDKDIIVIELLNLNKSSIILEPGSIEPLDMFLGNVLGWFKRYYAITEEEPEQEEENTNIKDIKIRTSWSKILKEDGNEWSDTDKEYIILDIDIKGVSWDLGCDIMDTLENKINEDGFYSCSREGCPDFDEERGTFSDCLLFKRDYGAIKEQRRDIINYINSIKKKVIKEVLEQKAR